MKAKCRVNTTAADGAALFVKKSQRCWIKAVEEKKKKKQHGLITVA